MIIFIFNFIILFFFLVFFFLFSWEVHWPYGTCARLSIECDSGFKPWLGTMRCVLGQHS